MPRRKKNGGLEDLNRLFMSTPWWVGPMAAGIVFACFRFLFPALAANLFDGGNTDAARQIGGNLTIIAVPFLVKMAPWAAGLVLVVWLFTLPQKLQRRTILAVSNDLESVRSLSWRDFELLVGEYYRQSGFAVEERGGPSPDGGVDLVLRRGGRVTLVQCKHWKKSQVGVREVRELCGIIQHEGAHEAVLVTSGTFTNEARDFAAANRVSLVDGTALAAMLKQHHAPGTRPAHPPAPTPAVQAPPRPANVSPKCPKCGSPMETRTARTGPRAGKRFWGCQRYPACNGTINIEDN
jgi:restriction system protein